jgi:hypothetical protein
MTVARFSFATRVCPSLVAVAPKEGTLDGLQQFADRPCVVRDPRFHGRRHSQRSVDVAKVVIGEPQRVDSAISY